MEFIDTHSHLYLNDFKTDIDEIIDRCLKQEINKIFLPNIDRSSIGDLYSLQDRFPEICFPMMGLHPCSVKENWKQELKDIEIALEKRKNFAIGEIGLDYHWDTTYKKEQQSAFRIQIDWAKKKNLPIVIHSRNSFEDVIKILHELKDDRLKGVCHCFTGNMEDAQKAIELGFYLGIGGVVTFKNSGLDRTLKEVDLQHIVLETDAPYLAPVPYRGKRNESSYIRIIAEKVAEIKNLDLEHIAKVTTENAKRLFQID